MIAGKSCGCDRLGRCCSCSSTISESITSEKKTATRPSGPSQKAPMLSFAGVSSAACKSVQTKRKTHQDLDILEPLNCSHPPPPSCCLNPQQCISQRATITEFQCHGKSCVSASPHRFNGAEFSQHLASSEWVLSRSTKVRGKQRAPPPPPLVFAPQRSSHC